MNIDPLTDKMLKEFKERLANLQHIHMVLNAFFDGRTIEYSLDDTNWYEIPSNFLPGHWDWDHWHVRIKTRQIRRTIYVPQASDGVLYLGQAKYSIAECKSLCPSCTVIAFVEVIE